MVDNLGNNVEVNNWVIFAKGGGSYYAATAIGRVTKVKGDSCTVLPYKWDDESETLMPEEYKKNVNRGSKVIVINQDLINRLPQ